MPTVLIAGYKFRFYSSDRLEPPHVHVLRGSSRAKVWLTPVTLAASRGYNERELNTILNLATAHRDRLLEVWYDYFGAAGG
ncbi:MAG: DUF4160 domain-containing protein [Chloroflexi bacterium]|nr:DUF4160 domain-containing protein [Chloroflexota bacterium]